MTHIELVLWCGLAIGALFGAAGQISGFCLTRGLKGLWVEGETAKIRAFALAAAVALVGSQALEALGLVSFDRSFYLQPSVSWFLVPLGGALFGYGMVLANGCGARALVLLGSGNLRSFVVLLCLGISAFVVLTGVLAPLRSTLAAATTVALPLPRLSSLLGVIGSGEAARWLAVALVAGPLLVFALGRGVLAHAPRDLLGGLVIGLLVPACWFVTGNLGADDFDPVPLAALTFIAPIGESIQYLMLASGTALGFGVAIIGGVLLGALVTALASGGFALRGFDGPLHMLRSMAGGSLMGLGGALALGCSIGQGLSGLSTLALASFLAVAGILLGARLGLRGPLAAPLR